MQRHANWAKSVSVILVLLLLITGTGYTLPAGEILSLFTDGKVEAAQNEPGSIDSEEGLEEDLNLPEEPDSIDPGEDQDFADETEALEVKEEEEEEEDLDVKSKKEKIEVIIGFNNGKASRNANRSMVEGLGGEISEEFTIVNAIVVRLPQQAIDALSKRHEISYIEPNSEVF